MADVNSCPSCGGDVPATAAFCPNCGNATEGSSTDDPTQLEPAPTERSSTGSSAWTPPDDNDDNDDDRTRVDLPVNDPTAVLPQHQKTDGTPPPPPVWSPPERDEPAPPPDAPPTPQWSAPPAAASPPTWQQGPSAPPPGPPPFAPAPAQPGYQGAAPAAHPGAPGAPAKRKRRRSIVGGLLGIIGGGAAIVAVFLDWIELTSSGSAESFTGFDATDDSRIALAVGIAAVVVGLLLFITRFVLLRLALLAAGAGTIAIFIRDFLDAPEARDAVGAESYTIGIGLWVLLGAGAVMLLGGLASLLGGSGKAKS